jgi:hypothetical protein
MAPFFCFFCYTLAIFGTSGTDFPAVFYLSVLMDTVAFDFYRSLSVDDMMGREGIDMGLFQTSSPLSCACDLQQEHYAFLCPHHVKSSTPF